MQCIICKLCLAATITGCHSHQPGFPPGCKLLQPINSLFPCVHPNVRDIFQPVPILGFGIFGEGWMLVLAKVFWGVCVCVYMPRKPWSCLIQQWRSSRQAQELSPPLHWYHQACPPPCKEYILLATVPCELWPVWIVRWMGRISCGWHSSGLGMEWVGDRRECEIRG